MGNKKTSNLWVVLKQIVNSPTTWLVLACLPAIFIFANRVLIPDHSTDILSYHLFNGLRAWSHPFVPFLPSEFYPVGIANIAPYYDALIFGFRSLVGYRLGTSLSLLAAFGCVWIIYLLLQQILKEQKKRFHAGWGLLLVNAAIVLELEFQLATYFIDIINAFFVLLVFYTLVRLILSQRKNPLTMKYWLGLWLALGGLLALKQTNLPFVVSMAAILFWLVWRRRKQLEKTKILVLLAISSIALLPLLPGWIANYRLTQNPLFPYYNGIFHSVYYPNISFTDTTFGGTNLIAKIFWPVASLANQLRLGEPHHIYNDYKLVTYWVVAILLLSLTVLRWIKIGKTSKLVLYYFLASTFLWGLAFGIERYFISSMLLGGLLLVILLASEITKKLKPKKLLLVVGLMAIAILSIENYRIMHFNLRYDVSWRPGLYNNVKLHKAQRKALFANKLDLTEAQLKTVKQADLLLACDTNVSGLIVLLPGIDNKPMVNIIAYNLPQYANMSQNPDYQKQRLARLHSQLPKQKTYTWVSVMAAKDIGPTDINCQKNIAANHGQITNQSEIKTFLGFNQIQTTLISGTISF